MAFSRERSFQAVERVQRLSAISGYEWGRFIHMQWTRAARLFSQAGDMQISRLHPMSGSIAYNSTEHLSSLFSTTFPSTDDWSEYILTKNPSKAQECFWALMGYVSSWTLASGGGVGEWGIWLVRKTAPIAGDAVCVLVPAHCQWVAALTEFHFPSLRLEKRTGSSER